MSEDNDKKDKKQVDTVKSAMDYVDTPASSFSNWKVKDLGLQFLLFGIAELNAKRAVRLMGFVSDLEDAVFDPDMIRELQPKELLGAYKLSTETMRDTLDYIAKTRKEMDWTAINEQLAEMSKPEEGSASIRKDANKLIEAMKNFTNLQEPEEKDTSDE